MKFYPDISAVPVAEFWHSKKWREYNPDKLTPMMVKNDNTHFYVNELTRCSNGSFVIPVWWVMKDGQLHAQAYPVQIEASVVVKVKDEGDLALIPSSECEQNYFELLQEGLVPEKWHGKCKARHIATLTYVVLVRIDHEIL